eukprot:c23997_g1_i1 orf=51-1379(+)
MVVALCGFLRTIEQREGDRRRMSRGMVSYHASRSLDSCTLQLGNWNPFASAASVANDQSKGADSSLGSCENVVHGDCRIEKDPGSALPSSASKLDSGLRSPGTVRSSSNPRQNGRGPDLVKCALKQIADRGAGKEKYWSPVGQELGLRYHPAGRVCDSSGLSLQIEESESTERLGPAPAMKKLCGYYQRSTEAAVNSGSDSSDCDRIRGSQSILSTKGCGWSKRQKQLSRALARGLWRWKEGSHSRKRRRRAETSCSGSDRTGHGGRMYASDPPTVCASATYATCSDLPVAGTDSSGELFFCGDENGVNWDPEFSSMNEGPIQRCDCGEPHYGWPMTDNQSLESGYGSEPGYRGGDELGYEDEGPADDQDEEESYRLSKWKDRAATDTRMDDIQERVPDPDALDEDDADFVAELVSLRNPSDQKMHHRLRRRRQDYRLPSCQ